MLKLLCTVFAYDICGSSYRDWRCTSESKRRLIRSSGYVIWAFLYRNTVTEHANSGNNKYGNRKPSSWNARYAAQARVMYDMN